MKRTLTLAAVAGIVAATVGATPAAAVPDDSQRLRGLGDRHFAVEVSVVESTIDDLPAGATFPNCYAFDSDETWTDPQFPVPGQWEQHTNGASTSYSATADVTLPDSTTIALVQRGTVSPRGGVLHLGATSTLTIHVGDVELSATLRSVGTEVDNC